MSCSASDVAQNGSPADAHPDSAEGDDETSNPEGASVDDEHSSENVNSLPLRPPGTISLDDVPQAKLVSACPYGEGVVSLSDYVKQLLTTDGDDVFFTTDLGLHRLRPDSDEPEFVMGSSELTACSRVGADLVCASQRLWTIPLDGGEPSYLTLASGGIGSDHEFIYTFDGQGQALVRKSHDDDQLFTLADLSDSSLRSTLAFVSPTVSQNFFAYAENSAAFFITPVAHAEDRSIVRVDKADGAVSELGQTHALRGLTADETHLYFSNEGTYGIEKLSVDGASQGLLSDVPFYPHGIDVDSDFVYWAGHVLADFKYFGAILRTPKSGGITERLARFEGIGLPLKVGTNCVFWVAGETLYGAAR